MLWRSHVEPSPVDPGPWAGDGPDARGWACLVGFGALSFRERSVWKRLFLAEAPDFPLVETVVAQRTEWAAIRSSVPPSEREGLAFRESWDEVASLAKEPVENCALALLIEGDRVVLGFQGVPNEEAWERFLSVIRTP